MRVDTSLLRQTIRHTPHPLPPPPASGYQPASVFLLIFNITDPHILAIQKSDRDGYPWRNQIALPGGHIDRQDHSNLAAAYRELKEEVGIEKSAVDLLGSLGHFQTILKKDIEAFAGIWDETGSLRSDPSEIARILKLSLTELVQIHKSSGFSGRIPHVGELIYPIQDVTVWGLTARIVHYLIELLYPA